MVVRDRAALGDRLAVLGGTVSELDARGRPEHGLYAVLDGPPEAGRYPSGGRLGSAQPEQAAVPLLHLERCQPQVVRRVSDGAAELCPDFAPCRAQLDVLRQLRSTPSRRRWSAMKREPGRAARERRIYQRRSGLKGGVGAKREKNQNPGGMSPRGTQAAREALSILGSLRVGRTRHRRHETHLPAKET